MKSKFIIFSALLLMSLFSISSYAQGYKIKIKVNGLHNDSLILGHYNGEKLFPDDTCISDKDGAGLFSNKSKLEGGLYVILIPSKRKDFFEFIVPDNQNISLETDTNNFVMNMKVIESKENELFFDFQKKMGIMKIAILNLQERYKLNSGNQDTINLITEQYKTIEKNKDEYWDKVVKDNPTTLFAKIVKAMTKVTIPEPAIAQNVANRDSLVRVFKYNYNVNHYFDNIDFNEPRLIRTPFVESRLKEYYSKNIVFDYDSISKAAIRLCEKARVNKEFFKYIVNYSTDYFLTNKVIGMDAVFVNLADKYFLSGQATWADTSVMNKITKYANNYRYNVIGKVAHDMKLETPTGEFVSLHQVKAKYTVVVFWDPSCGHCQTEIPMMHEKYISKWKQEGVEVYAIYTMDKEDDWKKFIENKGLDGWINVFDRYYHSSFKTYYLVDTTPYTYVLDSKKKILSKKLGLDDIDKFLDKLLSIETKK